MRRTLAPLGAVSLFLLASRGAFAAPWAYIADSGDTPGTLAVIDTATNAVVAYASVGTIPAGVAVSPDGLRIYVAEFTGFSASTWVVDAATLQIVGQIGSGGESIALSPDGKTAYIPNFPNFGLSVVDTTTFEEIANVDVGDEPLGVAVSPDGTKVYVATPDVGPGIVSVIDAASNTVMATVPVGFGPRGLAITPDGKHVYVTNADEDPGTVSVIDTDSNTVTATVPVGIEPGVVAITPDGTRAFVGNTDPDQQAGDHDDVSVIDTATNTVVATVPVGHSPAGIDFTPDGKRAYVTNQYGTNTSLAGVVSVIDVMTSTEVDEIAVGLTPVSFGHFTGPVCPGFPLGCEDLGNLPPDAPTLRCESQANRQVEKLFSTIAKCHVTKAAQAFLQTDFDEDACEAAAKSQFEGKIAALNGCPGCLDPTTVENEVESVLNGFNGRIFCAGDTAFDDGDDTGFVPPDQDSDRCERRVARAAFALGDATFRCHPTLVRHIFTEQSPDDDTCEARARENYIARVNRIGASTLCPLCLHSTPRAAIGGQIESIVDGLNSLAYCANCVTDEQCTALQTCGGTGLNNVCGNF